MKDLKIVIILSFLSSSAFASGTDVDVRQSNDMNNQTAGAITGGKSYGIGGSDYDIGQCMMHVGGLTFAVGKRNKFCEGMDMIRMGMIDAGILHLCLQTAIGDNYDSLKDCQDGLAILSPPPESGPESEPTADEEDEEDEWREEQMAMQIDYDARISQLAAEVREQKAAPVESEFARRAAKARAILEGKE